MAARPASSGNKSITSHILHNSESLHLGPKKSQLKKLKLSQRLTNH
jgi:hypothetical protein